MDYIKPQKLSLRLHPEFSERWVQSLIANDPSILGIGDVVLRDQERIQPRAGRLDLLLQEVETKRRFEVELQLGATDEAHIIRTIEYWDIERKRYPQYEHCAVLIAEDITSRFLNVVALFNGAIPLIALQMQALRFGNNITLVFTKVMDELSRGLIDEDEDAESAPTDRAYWEKRGSAATVQLADDLMKVVREFDPTLDLKYNKFYIGLKKDGSPFNFLDFRPKKSSLNFEFKLPKTEEIDLVIERAGIESLQYNARYGLYRVSLRKSDVVEKIDTLRQLIGAAYKYQIS
jgi:predicted transport protein